MHIEVLAAVNVTPSVGGFTDSSAFIMILGMIGGLVALILLLRKAVRANPG